MRTTLLVLLFACTLRGAEADLILHHGKIITVNPKGSIAEAVALKGGRITAVGASSQILEQERGARTRVIDLKGSGEVEVSASPVPRIEGGAGRSLEEQVQEVAASITYGSRGAMKTIKNS